MTISVAMAKRMCEELTATAAADIARAQTLRPWLKRAATEGVLTLGEVRQFEGPASPWFARRGSVGLRGRVEAVSFVPTEGGWRVLIVAADG